MMKIIDVIVPLVLLLIYVHSTHGGKKRKRPRYDVVIPRISVRELMTNPYFRDGAHPFILELDWPAQGKWTLDYFINGTPDKIVDYFPINLRKNTHPHLGRVAYILNEMKKKADNPRYVLWRWDLATWRKYNKDMLPIPPIFDDFTWMNGAFPRRRANDWPQNNFVLHTQYRMLVIGERGSGMFLHKDGIETGTWQLSLAGRKRWVVCDPSQEPYLNTELDPFNWDRQRFPSFANANCSRVTVGPGDLLYYPPHYWHVTELLDEDFGFYMTGRTIVKSNYRRVFSTLQDHCRYPGEDISLKHEGAAPNLSPTNCANLPHLYELWRDKFESNEPYDLSNLDQFESVTSPVVSPQGDASLFPGSFHS